ncbi:MAG: hypothetical protein K2W94_08725 [Alphaproteobacteria bacterium]|nr:hypothetical protein [Alphaproteobacteria bacterium]
MCIKPIKTIQDFHQATQRAILLLEELWPLFPLKKKNNDDCYKGDEFEILTILMELYKKDHYLHCNKKFSDPIEAINNYMHEYGLKFSDFARLIGSEILAHDILKKDQLLSLDHIYTIVRNWQIPAIILLQPYKITASKDNKVKVYH